MPQASPSPTTPTPGFNEILLVEEYDALALALDSALTKFAPHNPIRRSSSIAEAAEMARKTAPALVIVDFDPAGPGLTKFLCQLRDECPGTRVLIMGPGMTHELASGFRSLGAVEFVEKPFEIVDLGAAVQALLGPWKNADADQPRSSIGMLAAADIVLAQCAGGRTCRLEIKAGKQFGEIHIADGQLIGAIAGKLKNADALNEMFSWSDARLREFDAKPGVRRSIRRDWREAVLEAARHAHAARRKVTPQPRIEKPAKTARPAVVEVPVKLPVQPPPKTGKKIVVIDDTEMLLIFVEDTLATADPQLQIATAPTGLTGLKQVELIHPDLVLLDYSLPDINGDEVCRRLLENEQTASVPVLMMSGHVPEMTATAEEFGNVVGTIAKPFMSEALVALVQQTLRAGLRPAPKKPRARRIPAAPAAPAIETPHVAEAKPASPLTKSAAPPEAKQAAPAPPPPVLKTPEAQQPTAPPKPATPPPTPTPPEPTPPTRVPAPPAAISAPLVSRGPEEVVIGMSFEVVSMQLTPTLRMGTIRARLSSNLVSLHASRSAVPAGTAFHLADARLNPDGTLAALRVEPTQKPFQPLPTRSAVQVGGLSVVPAESRTAVQLTPSPGAPMMMHLLARLTLGGVELSPGLQLARLILHSRSTTVRVTLSSDLAGGEQTGVFCEMGGINVDATSRIVEAVLKPLK